jgi:WhiB family redox-sensing transcriptional regulator
MTVDAPDWRSDAACAQTDPGAFFPENGGSLRHAQKICATCEVVSKCLRFALDNNINHGIYGGLTAQQRRQLKKVAA